ncbi:MAG: nucleoside triphosphate pyrophosphohydrolase [Pseudomonadales bacterium]|nr:nucleoside triphosphate pyrophosphohydrolase [Pseudomonadales bacterium]
MPPVLNNPVVLDKPIDELLYIIKRLRDPETGCPWDVKQTFKTIAPHTIEEAYEVVDAIDKGDPEHIKEEVGDLLLQVMLYAQIGQDNNQFDFDGVVQTLSKKLLHRHPHVFPDGTPESQIDPDAEISVEQVAENWKKAKAEEKALKEKASGEKTGADKKPPHLLDEVHSAMPSITRALKLQKKAAKVGFDWPDVMPVLAKINEEVAELNEAIEKKHSKEDVMGEIGDILFCCINLCRHFEIDADEALKVTNEKFISRFNRVEDILMEANEQIESVGLERMDECWDQAKTEERQK